MAWGEARTIHVNVYSTESITNESIESKELDGVVYIGARITFGDGTQAVTIWMAGDDKERKAEVAWSLRKLAMLVMGEE